MRSAFAGQFDFCARMPTGSPSPTRWRHRAAALGYLARRHARVAIAVQHVRFTAGLEVCSVFDAGNERDAQPDITWPDCGTPFSPLERPIGFVVPSTQGRVSSAIGPGPTPDTGHDP